MSAARRLLQFIDASPSPFHAVKESVKMLEGAGFQCLRETDSWVERVQRGGKYYVTRNQSSLFAFVVPPAYEVGDGFNIIGAHTDSPCLRVRSPFPILVVPRLTGACGCSFVLRQRKKEKDCNKLVCKPMVVDCGTLGSTGT